MMQSSCHCNGFQRQNTTSLLQHTGTTAIVSYQDKAPKEIKKKNIRRKKKAELNLKECVTTAVWKKEISSVTRIQPAKDSFAALRKKSQLQHNSSRIRRRTRTGKTAVHTRLCFPFPHQFLVKLEGDARSLVGRENQRQKIPNQHAKSRYSNHTLPIKFPV